LIESSTSTPTGICAPALTWHQAEVAACHAQAHHAQLGDIGDVTGPPDSLGRVEDIQGPVLLCQVVSLRQQQQHTAHMGRSLCYQLILSPQGSNLGFVSFVSQGMRRWMLDSCIMEGSSQGRCGLCTAHDTGRVWAELQTQLQAAVLSDGRYNRPAIFG
jgi:hypothetical protein